MQNVLRTTLRLIIRRTLHLDALGDAPYKADRTIGQHFSRLKLQYQSLTIKLCIIWLLPRSVAKNDLDTTSVASSSPTPPTIDHPSARPNISTFSRRFYPRPPTISSYECQQRSNVPSPSRSL